MSSPAMIINDEIDQGATFYREVQLFTDKTKTVVIDITNKTVRASLMNKNGVKVADFSCSKLDAANGKLAWTMPRSLTSTLDYKKMYIHNIDLDDIDGVTTDRAVEGSITVNCGQSAPAVV